MACTLVRQLLQGKPNDPSLNSLHERLTEKLKEAYHKELLGEVTNPLQDAVEIMNLTSEELEIWMQSFEKLDTKKEGKISMEQLFDFLDIYPSNVFKEVFHHIDAQDEENYIEFGDYIRACAVFCFFGKEEILKFVFLYPLECMDSYEHC